MIHIIQNLLFRFINFLWPSPHFPHPTLIHLEIDDEDFDFVLQQHKPSLQFRPYAGMFIFWRPAVNMTFPIFSCFCQIFPPVLSSRVLPLLLLHVQFFPVQTNSSERLHLKSLLQRNHLHNLWSEKRISRSFIVNLRSKSAFDIILLWPLICYQSFDFSVLTSFVELFSVKYFSSSDGQSKTKKKMSGAYNFSYNKCNGMENFVLKPIHSGTNI
jgi:hypothetical protein